MFRVLILILILTGSTVLAQTEDKTPVDRQPEPIKLYDFGKATDGYVKMLFTDFETKLNADPTAQGYIINYGTDRELRIRERQILKAISFCRIDPARITIMSGGNIGKQRTTVWLVPAGTESPTPEK